MKIFLIGYRCTGKTTVGHLFAKQTKFIFRDIDQIVEHKAKINIAQIIKKHGWDNFRILEKEALFKLKNLEKSIISTGGGIVIDPGNIEFIKNNGFCIWLDADFETIIKRLKNDENTLTSRPFLTDKNLIEETKQLLNIRKPLYEKCANMKIDTTDKTPEEIVTNIEEIVTDIEKIVTNIIDRRIKNVRQYNR